MDLNPSSYNDLVHEHDNGNFMSLELARILGQGLLPYIPAKEQLIASQQVKIGINL